MAFTDDLFDPMLDAAGSLAASASLHSADPGSDGSNEISGGSYARQPLSWSPADAGVVEIDGDVVWDVPAASTVAWLGLWNNGDFLGGVELSSSEDFTDAGTYTLTSGSITAQNPS